MDIDPEIDLEQLDDDISTVPQYISNTTTASSITSNRDLLSKLIDSNGSSGFESRKIHRFRILHQMNNNS
jgi:hypothetical protein